MAFWKQIRVLHFRNMCIRRHHWIAALFEILIPTVIFGLLSWAAVKHSFSVDTRKNETSYFAYNETNILNSLFLESYESVDFTYAPKNDVTEKIVTKMVSILKPKAYDAKINVTGVDSEADIVDRYNKLYGKEHYKSKAPAFGIYFRNIISSKDAIPRKVDCIIRPVGEIYDTNTLLSSINGFSEGASESYLRYGFLAVELAMNLAIQQLNAPSTSGFPKISIEQLPSPPSSSKFSSFDIFFQSLPLGTVFSVLLLFPFLLRNVISEKETGAKELQKMMGLKSWMTWVGWLMAVFMTQIIAITIIVVFLTAPVFGSPLLKSSPVLLWVYLMLYVLVAICFSFALCPIFKRPTVGVCVGLIAWFATSHSFTIPRGSRFKVLDNLLFLFPNIVLNRGWDSIHYFESRTNGADWSNFFTRPVDQSSFSLATIFISFILQCVVFSIITWYLDAVRPGPYGIPESPIFFLKKSYWTTPTVPKDFSNDDWNPESNKNFEPVSRDLKPGIQVRNLTKSFKNVTAVNRISVNFYQGEITALLGHNGAGKTTTMSMLTGMIPADSGKVIVDDYNIFDNISQFRQNLGLCPQHNLLFNYLNVIEHLIFFGLLKGLSKKQAYAEALHLMELQNISSKKTAMTTQLSGGMKRKLSLAIALIGSPKILMLDEPTSGMDPESRREMWNLLLNMRGERTIILTTHFMEEADVLGDRIAIMDHGEIQCFGTSIMLKKLYGAGYYLNVLKKKNFTQNRDLITSAIQEFIPEAELKSDDGPKLTYILPTETVDAFPAMFTKLESLKNELGISSLGIACTTMEEVFLKVGQIAAEERETADSDSANSQETYSQFNNPEGDSPKIKPQSALFCQQISALLNKKIKYSFRRRVMYFIFGIVPILGAIFANILANGQKAGPPPLPALNLDSSVYDFMQVLYFGDDSNPYVSHLNELLSPQSASKIVAKDVNKFNITRYLLDLGAEDESKYYSDNLMALTINNSAIVAFFNQHAIHSMPIALNLACNLISMAKENRTVSTTIHPISISKVDFCSGGIDKSERFLSNVLIWSQFFAVPLLVLMGSFIAFPIVERLNNAKQLQLMTGVSPAVYWFTTLIVDYSYYILISFLCVLIFVLNGNLYIEAALVLCMILMISGVSNILFAYILSYFRKSYASSYSLYLNLSLFIGTYGAIIVFSLLKLNTALEGTIDSIVEAGSNTTLAGGPNPHGGGGPPINTFWLGLADLILKLLPQYSFLISLACFLDVATDNAWCMMCPDQLINKQHCSMRPFFEYSRKDLVGLNDYLIALVVDAVLYLAIICLTELGLLEQLSKFVFILIHGERFKDEDRLIDDPDVHDEKDKVDSAKEQPENVSDHVLIVDNLVKKFSRYYAAVRGISFAVKPGECFGLLGVNGAGKTTTFRMITGDTLPTIGECSIFNYFLSKNRQKYLSMIGYCPQFDGINEYLTGYEMLETFAMLRGIPRTKISSQINKWIVTLGLQEYKHNLCGTYSGGNKRKLSTAMALIGDPSLVILDEPTSGVDPISRRKLWNVLIESRQRGQAIVFTSHSMDECETLCDRLTIMVAGKMMCIGNVEYLKQRYAQGYSIMIKLGNAQEADLFNLKTMVSESFEFGIELKDEHAGLLNYHVTSPTVPLSELFTKLQNIRENMNIVEDYQICNTTLEQVFLAFARSEARIIET